MSAKRVKQGYLPTEDFAKKLHVKPGTARRALCKKGHYLGIKPIKLKNGRLLWPDINPEDVAV